MPLTATQRLNAHTMGLTEEGGEALLAFTSNWPNLAKFPMEDYTSGNAPVSDSNFADALNGAVAAAQEEGGVVLIPAGTWNVSDEFVFASAGRTKPVFIQGAGLALTTILVPVGFTGTLFKFSGMPDDGAEDLFYDGGLSDLTISCLEEDEDTTGTAVKLAACIQTQFVNLTIRNFTGGNGFWASYDPDNVDFTSQYVQLYNLTVTGCDINFYLDAFINCTGYFVASNSPVTNDFLIPNAKVSFYGGNIQSSAARCVNFTGRGGSIVVFHNFYHEGSAGTLFYMPVPDGSNQVAIYNFHCGGAPTIFADADFATDLTVYSANGIENSGKILKARNGARVTMVECSDPIEQPTKFDLDATSRASLTCISRGRVYASKHSLAKIAVGSVGAGPVLFVDSADNLLKFKNEAGVVGTVTVV